MAWCEHCLLTMGLKNFLWLLLSLLLRPSDALNLHLNPSKIFNRAKNYRLPCSWPSSLRKQRVQTKREPGQKNSIAQRLTCGLAFIAASKVNCKAALAIGVPASAPASGPIYGGSIFWPACLILFCDSSFLVKLKYILCKIRSLGQLILLQRISSCCRNINHDAISLEGERFPC
jgi:hypothetical protein